MRKPGEEHTIHLEGKPVRFLLKRGSSSRINIRVSLEGEVKVSAPSAIPVRRIKEALLRKEKWIIRHLKRMESVPLPNPLESVLFKGIVYRVELKKGKIPGNLQFFPEKHLIHLYSPEGDRSQAVDKLEKGLRKKARHYLSLRLEELSQKTGIPYRRLSVRNQRTRWGSSSSLGNININWRIIMANEKVIDYLLIHELVHQVHHNHSKEFYAAVEVFIPEYKDCNAWLKSNALILSQFRSRSF